MCKAHIQKILNGDIDAFRFIIEKHKDDAYSLAVSIVKDEVIAKDVIQNAFIQAYNNLPSFEGKSKFSTWFYRIVVNESYTQIRKRNKHLKVFENVEKANESSITENPDSKIDESNQRYYINETLKILPANYSLVLRLFYLKEFNIEEITDITGWTGSNVKVTLHRARNKANEILKNLLKVNKEELY